MLFAAVGESSADTSEAEVPKSLVISTVLVVTADLFSVLGNTSDLVGQTPHRTRAYFGIATGVVSIAFGFASRYSALSPFFGVAGGLSLGLSAFNLRQGAVQSETGESSSRISLAPALVNGHEGFAPGVSLTWNF
jgi:hypothetical protein